MAGVMICRRWTWFNWLITLIYTNKPWVDDRELGFSFLITRRKSGSNFRKSYCLSLNNKKKRIVLIWRKELSNSTKKKVGLLHPPLENVRSVILDAQLESILLK